jgi:hypothetical protein
MTKEPLQPGYYTQERLLEIWKDGGKSALMSFAAALGDTTPASADVAMCIGLAMAGAEHIQSMELAGPEN